MHLITRHHRIARTIWECCGNLGEVAVREHVGVNTLRRWLADPAFRALVARHAAEPLLQATGAVLRWAPVAVARLIEDLPGASPAEARHAAREILKLAIETQRDLAAGDRRAQTPAGQADADPPSAANDPLSRSVAALPDDQLAKLLAMLNSAAKGATP
jgi:hypothetical protein